MITLHSLSDLQKTQNAGCRLRGGEATARMAHRRLRIREYNSGIDCLTRSCTTTEALAVLSVVRRLESWRTLHLRIPGHSNPQPTL